MNVADPGAAFYDIELWKANRGPLMLMSENVISIKHGLGHIGGSGHKSNMYRKYDDQYYSKLWELVDGEAFNFYTEYRKELCNN